jgi:addiction module toxin, RelE/StbE family
MHTNEVEYTPHFCKLYRKKCQKEPEYIIKKMDDGLTALMHSPEPERLGEAKKGKLMGYYSYDINKRHRILYTVHRLNDSTLVTLHRVCDHKQSYDKD